MFCIRKKYLLTAMALSCMMLSFVGKGAQAASTNESVDFLANYFHLLDSYEKQNGRQQNIIVNTDHLQQLSLSFTGSTGLLNFGSGYIYTGQELPQNTLHSFQKLGFREYSLSEAVTDPFIGLNANYSKEIFEDVVVGFGASLFYGKDSREMLFGPNESSNIKVLFLLDLPVNFGKSITISPEFQWSQSYSTQTNGFTPADDPNAKQKPDIYGGVSIHFAY